jgi:SAM-dependent methyltransferase
VSRAQERTAGAADLRVHDLSEPLTWVPDDSIDLVVCALTLHYIDDRAALLREFGRVLAPGGAVVLSTHHPTSDWLRLGGSYFTERVVTESLHPERDWPVRFWRRSLTAMCAEFREAGFLISELVEPRPLEEMARRDADAYTTPHHGAGLHRVPADSPPVSNAMPRTWPICCGWCAVPAPADCGRAAARTQRCRSPIVNAPLSSSAHSGCTGIRTSTY